MDHSLSALVMWWVFPDKNFQLIWISTKLIPNKQEMILSWIISFLENDNFIFTKCSENTFKNVKGWFVGEKYY